MRKDKNIAIKLRRQGKTYNAISSSLNIPKSTLSRWFLDLEIPASIKKRIWTNAQKTWAQSITLYNKKRALDSLRSAQEAQELSAKDVGRLTFRELMLVGAALYWAEGNKRDRWRIRFSNSDPAIIALMMRFFREICKVVEDKFIAEIHLYPHMPEEEIRLFWSRLTKIPLSQFRKSYYAVSKSSKLKRPNNTLPYGTLQINISDVKLVNYIKGLILGLSHAI